MSTYYTKAGIVDALAVGAGTGAYEYAINKRDKETSIKLGAVMAGTHVAVTKAGSFMGMTKPGLNMIVTAAGYTYFADKVVDTGYDSEGYMPRALAALGGLVAGNVSQRVMSRMTSNSTSSNMIPSTDGGATHPSVYTNLST